MGRYLEWDYFACASFSSHAIVLTFVSVSDEHKVQDKSYK